MTMGLTFPTPAKRQIWSGLQGAALGFAIAEWVQQTRGVACVVMPDQLSANQLQQTLSVFLPAVEVQAFPDWETLPYDRFSPYHELISQRLLTLNRLLHAKPLVVVSTIATLLHRLCPASYLVDRVWSLQVGQQMDPLRLRQALEAVGYTCMPQVMAYGEFAVRGSLMDVYPMGSEWPFRIEYFDQDIESIRTFDPETQRTIEKTQAIHIFPAREFPTDSEAITRFRRQYRDHFPDALKQSVMYESVSEGQFPAGSEYYLPLFFDKTASIFDYLPPDAQLFMVGPTDEIVARFWKDLNARYESYAHENSWPILRPEKLFLEATEWHECAASWPVIQVESMSTVSTFDTLPPPALLVKRQAAKPFDVLQQYLQEKSDWRVLVVVESAGRREVLLSLLSQQGLSPTTQPSWQAFCDSQDAFSLLIAPLTEGMVLSHAKVAVIVEAQLFGEAPVPQGRSAGKSVSTELMIRDLMELQPNMPVVHLTHGVGRYVGLKTLDLQGVLQDFIELLYAGGDKVYVPVTALQAVTRYTGGDAEHAPLTRLGSEAWVREKNKAIEKIHDVAVELLEIYAKRQLKSGVAFQQPEEYVQFASEFPFVPTVDQTRAIEDVLHDLQQTVPMDRLICGDVGFGKTEVAMRAAFVAVQNGRQVCVLVPTTLLATQHAETFQNRFASFPIRIGLLSRFKSAKESAKVLADLKSGALDIVIGTHKLLMKQIPFHALGLLVIDEEHRFGVKQKETLKALKQEVHCLTMTATPIPRTLNMAMSGLRDISLITTPPLFRLAIKTFWREKSDALIREAVLREIARGGQVFYLHNDVASMPQVTDALLTLIPEAKIRFAHGQMPEHTLEHLMADFYHQRFNVLVCTTIIETGIDIPTANTIIMERADLFGLAQLHQLRGRVGRSHHQAYAYLLTPPVKSMTSDAVKRLEAIVSMEALGSGFMLASHDLEIRGAGELLGDEQSGNMHAIGFTLYMELLEQAVQSLKADPAAPAYAPNQTHSEVEVYFSALFPEAYIGDLHLRLVLYKRLANAVTTEALEALQVECIDRFGLLPSAAQALFQMSVLKLQAKSLGIERIQLTMGEGKLYFAETPRIRAEVLIELIQKESACYRMQGSRCLRFQLPTESPEKAMQAVATLLNRLT